MSGRKDGSSSLPSDPLDPRRAAGERRRVAGPGRIEDRVLRIDDAHERRVPPEAGVPSDRRARPACAGADDDPRGDRMPLEGHLGEDRLRDVVVAAPIGRALREGELIQEVSAELGRQPLRLGIHDRRVVDQVARPSLRLDQRDLLGARRSRHDGDERQAQEAGEVRLRDGRRAARRLDDRRSLGDPAVAQAVEEQRAGESMLEGARRVHRLVLQVEIDAPLGRKREGVQMGVGRPVGVRLEPGDRLVRPGPGTKPLTAKGRLRHSLKSAAARSTRRAGPYAFQFDTVALTCDETVVPSFRSASTRKTCVPFGIPVVSRWPPMLSP